MAETQFMGTASLWSPRTMLFLGTAEKPKGRAAGHASISHLKLTNNGEQRQGGVIKKAETEIEKVG